jgi:uncharacterized lipoprotein YajG
VKAMRHTPRRRSSLAHAALWIGLVAAALPALGCARHSNTLQVSPPLPAAEEPSDDVKGVYAADAGAQP